MKANFALSLSFDGIHLLHRAAGGWRPVGAVDLSDPDLPAALEALRKTALGLEPTGLRTKLIIPSSQIKYLTIETGPLSPEDRRIAAAAALDGATPYAVADLAFDVSEEGNKTHIAAVARETLREASDFAAQYKFNPISAVAVPEEAGFLGEPFFGPSELAASLLAPGERVEPDGVAVVVLDAPDIPDGPVVVVEQPVAAAPEPEIATPPEDLSGGAKPGGTDIEARQKVEAAPTVDEPVQPVEDIRAPDISDPIPAPAPGFASRRNKPPALGGVTRSANETDAQTGGAVLSASLPEDPTRTAPSHDDDDSRIAATAQSAAQSLRRAAAGTAAATGAFFSRRAARQEPAPAAPIAPVAAAAPSAAIAPISDRDARAATAAVGSPKVPRPADERQRMTIFGARKSDAVGGKPRFLGLILTAVLLLFLAGVAAWAAVFREDGLAGFFSPRAAPEIIATADELAPEPEVSGDPATLETASLDPNLLPPLDSDPVRAAPEAPLFDIQAAEEFYAVTGIWTIPPIEPDAPRGVVLDDLYLTSIDPASLNFDAVALIPPGQFDGDTALADPGTPAPAGTQFALDARGLVIPTAQGALTPDGVTVFLGKPPVLPPARPESALAEAPDEADTNNALLAAFRPKARPENLVEQTERDQLGGISRAELAKYRPKLRPVAEKEVVEEQDETPTAQAIAQSRRPDARPRNFARVVERARKHAAETPAAKPETTRVAAIAPRTVKPSIPSRASVAKSATVKNAINLNRINLIGVYGKPSSRSALIRLSNGRYKKVKVGDRIDGGRVSAIGEGEVRYKKGSRNVVLKMPKT